VQLLPFTAMEAQRALSSAQAANGTARCTRSAAVAEAQLAEGDVEQASASESRGRVAARIAEAQVRLVEPIWPSSGQIARCPSLALSLAPDWVPHRGR
jgi:hypothetical protein